MTKYLIVAEVREYMSLLMKEEITFSRFVEMLNERQAATKWQQGKPPVNKWVIVHTPNCKYPACAAYWNGLNWVDDEKRVIENVTHWAEVVTPPN
jgi:hypothetical protein